MGELIGGIFGGIGSVAGAAIQANAAERAAAQALTGYNYLTSGGGKSIINDAVASGGRAGNMFNELVGINPVTAETANAWNKYRDSTGYQFQMDEGTDALISQASQRGLRNSGATAKALTKYGQNLASTTFNNYLNLLGGSQTAGMNAATTVANAGTGAGSQAAQYNMAGGNAWAQGVSGGLGGLGNAIANWPQ
jgi:hypothetical protein